MFDEALIAIVETISVAMLQSEPELASLADCMFDDHAITATIAIRGNFLGELRATFSDALAREVSGRFLGSLGRALDASDLRDAMGELANIIAGNLKGILPAPCHLSLPMVQTGGQVLVAYPSIQLGRATFRVLGEPMWVELTRLQHVKQL